jgi:hypothetical protein
MRALGVLGYLGMGESFRACTALARASAAIVSEAWRAQSLWK